MPPFFFLAVVVASAADAQELVGLCRDTPGGEIALIERYTLRVGASETSLSVQTLGQAGSA
jgi:hypothetical protein